MRVHRGGVYMSRSLFVASCCNGTNLTLQVALSRRAHKSSCQSHSDLDFGEITTGDLRDESSATSDFLFGDAKL